MGWNSVKFYIGFRSRVLLNGGLSYFTWQCEKKTTYFIATLILVTIVKYVKFCTFFKNLLHREIPALSAYTVRYVHAVVSLIF